MEYIISQKRKNNSEGLLENQNQMIDEEAISNSLDNKGIFSFGCSSSYKEIMVGSINRLKQLEIGRPIQQTEHLNKKEKQVETPNREFIQTFSFQNSIYIAYVNGSFIRITKQRFVKALAGGQQSDYQEFVYSLNENICNQIFFMGVENANHDNQLDNSVIIIIPCANGQIHVKQLIEKDALKWELNIEAHGQIIYSIGYVYQNSLKQRIELCACLANQKVFCYEIDVGSLNDPTLNFIRHTSEIKLFDNFFNQFYHQKFKQNSDCLLTNIIPVSRFILLAITKDFRLKIINYKQKQVKFEYPLLTDKETISLLDPFKHVKISALINNPLRLNSFSGIQQAINVLISVSFVNNSIINYVQLFNLEVIPQEELGQQSIVPDLSLSGGIGFDENNIEVTNPLAYCTNVKVGDLVEIFSIHNKSEITDVSLTQKGLYIASVPSSQNNSLQFLPYDNIMNLQSALSLSTVLSADFNVKNQLQQDLQYLDNDSSNMAFKEYPLNRLFRPDRFPLKLIHEFYGRYTEFKHQENYLGNSDIKRISEQLLMQNEMKFEAAMKNSLVSLTNNWIRKYPIVALHIDNRNTDMLPVVIRENGLFNLVPMSFYENLNFKLNEFVSEYTNSQKNQTTYREHNQNHIPQNKYSQDFSNSSVYLKYQNWCEQQADPSSNQDNYLPEIFELLSWTKLFLLPDILNCLNQCPYEQSFIQSIKQGIQSASNTLSYESLSDQFESILCDEHQKKRTLLQMKNLLEDILQELFHENFKGNAPVGLKEQPVLINIDFCVWSKNLVNGSIRFKIRELVELSLIILSFFKYIEYRKVCDEDFSYLEDLTKIVGIAYSITYLFDKPLLQIDKLNKLAIKDEDQTLDHILFMDVLSYFISSELTLMYSIARNDNLLKNNVWLAHNCLKVERSLFQNLSLQVSNNYLPSLLKFLQENHQYDISLCISQFFNQTPAILYSQVQCFYQLSQHKKVVLLLHQIISQIHITPSILNDGPWKREKHALAIHHDLKDVSVKEDIRFIRHCLLYFFKDSLEDLKSKYELAQMGLLLFSKYEEDTSNIGFRTSQNMLYKLEFMRACFIHCLQTSDHHQAFNYIKQMNEVQKKMRENKQILEECIQKFVQNLCNNEIIGIISQLVYEDDLSQQIERVINEENKKLLQLIIEDYQNEAQRYLYLDEKLCPENLYKFNSSMNFYISIKNYKQAGLSQWILYNTFKFISSMHDNDEPIPKYLYEKLLQLQIVALKQAQSLFQMAGYENDIVIYENYKCNEQERRQQGSGDISSEFIEEDQPRYVFQMNEYIPKTDQQYQWVSVKVIEKIIVELEARLTIEQCQLGDLALNITDAEKIQAYLIQFQKFDELITYMHEIYLDFTDILIYFTEMFYSNSTSLFAIAHNLFIFQEYDSGALPEEDEEIDYFAFIRRILIINQNQNYMKYSIIALKSYGSCITDPSQVGEKMKGFAQKLNLPKMNNFLFYALSDFGEDRILAEEIVSMARNELQNVNLQQVHKQVNQKQYIPLQLISKVNLILFISHYFFCFDLIQLQFNGNYISFIILQSHFQQKRSQIINLLIECINKFLCKFPNYFKFNEYSQNNNIF